MLYPGLSGVCGDNRPLGGSHSGCPPGFEAVRWGLSQWGGISTTKTMFIKPDVFRYFLCYFDELVNLKINKRYFTKYQTYASICNIHISFTCTVFET